MNNFKLITLISSSVIGSSSSLVSNVVGLKGEDSINYYSTYREEANGVEFPIRVKEKESHQVIPWTDLTPSKPIGQEVYETLEWRLKKFDRKHPFVATVAPDWSTLWDASIDSKRGQKYLQANMSKDWILCSYRLKFAGLDGWIGFTTGKPMHLNVIYAVTPTSHREYHNFWFLIK